MKTGTPTATCGIYTCLYHLKNKIKFAKGTLLPPCNYRGLNCEGEWHLIKEIKVKTKEEIYAAQLEKKKRQGISKARRRNQDETTKYPTFNKWDFEKW